MALTRAQLLMGDSSQGPVLAGQAQAVKAGTGISIDPSGVITVNSQSVIGLMKLGQTASSAAAAYNSYEWPTTVGTSGQQISIQTVSGVATLAWVTPTPPTTIAGGTGITVTGTGVNFTISINPTQVVTNIQAGSGINVTQSTGNVIVTATGGIGTITGVTAGAGLSGGGTTGNVTLTNTGITGLTAGSGINLSGGTGNVVITATGGGGGGTITGVAAGTNLSGGGSTGNVTLSLANTVTVSGQFISTSTGSGSSSAFLAQNGSVRASRITATGELSVSPTGSEVWLQCGTQANTTFNTVTTQIVQITPTASVNAINKDTASFNVNRPARGSLYVFYYVAGGSPVWGVDQNGNAGPPSDISLKTDIIPLSILPGSYLNRVCDLTPVRFEFIGAPGIERFGLIAQDAELLVPEIVNESVLPAVDVYGNFDPSLDGIDIKNVDYQGLSILCLEALKELKSDFDAYVLAHP